MIKIIQKDSTNCLNNVIDNFTDNKELKQYSPVVLGEEFASGAFGSVHMVDTPTGQIAVKRVPELEGHVNRELETCKILALENHPNIVQLLGYWTDKNTLYLVMEFMPETLGNLLERLAVEKMRLKIDKMYNMMWQLACALEFLEKIQLMHRDLKPDNILVNVNTNRLVLADFGSAKFVKEGQPNTTYVCTRFYRAPCLILGRDMYSTSIDIWSFGCILAEFAYGGPLFTGDNQIDVMTRIIRIRGMVTVDDIAHMPTHFSENIDLAGIGKISECKPWIKVFSRKNGNKRINTSYGEFYEEILNDCLQWNPSSRISAYKLQKKFFSKIELLKNYK
jgi:serine/threonine protein kinase